MKILYINCVCGVGSTGRIVTDLMKQVKQHSHIAKVACATVEPIRNVDLNDVIVVGSKLDYYAHNALSRLTDHEGLFSKRATRRLIKEIREFDPDIVHLHNLHGHWINYELLFQYLAEENKRVVWTLHDCWAFTGHCSHFNALKCEQWRTRCSNCPGLRGYPMCYGKGDVSRNYERKKRAFTSVKDMTIVTPSEWLAGLVRESFLSNYPVKAIPNGIDLSIFKPTESNFKEKHGIAGKKMILGVANVWSKRKGFNDILELSRLLDDSFSVVLVGLTEEQLDILPKGIIGITRTSNVQELAEIYSAADVFVNPTYEDNFPTVNLEALACGTPIITYNTGGSIEAIDRESGIVVEQGNMERLHEAVLEALSLKPERCINRSQSFSKVERYNDYIRLYGIIW